jgi:hypothetical protein
VGIGYPVDTQFAYHTIGNQLYAVPYQVRFFYSSYTLPGDERIVAKEVHLLKGTV